MSESVRPRKKRLPVRTSLKVFQQHQKQQERLMQRHYGASVTMINGCLSQQLAHTPGRRLAYKQARRGNKTHTEAFLAPIMFTSLLAYFVVLVAAGARWEPTGVGGRKLGSPSQTVGE